MEKPGCRTVMGREQGALACYWAQNPPNCKPKINRSSPCVCVRQPSYRSAATGNYGVKRPLLLTREAREAEEGTGDLFDRHSDRLLQSNGRYFAGFGAILIGRRRFLLKGRGKLTHSVCLCLDVSLHTCNSLSTGREM